MKYFIGTEFHNYEKKTGFFNQKRIRTIDLISIAIISEKGKEYFEVSKEFDLKAAWADNWIRQNVLLSIWNKMYLNEAEYTRTYFPHLINFSYEGLKNLISWHGKTKNEIARELKLFFTEDMKDESPEIYGYFCDFDYVVFSQLFGNMNHYPPYLPQYFIDIRQMMQESYRQFLRETGLTSENMKYDDWKNKFFVSFEDIHDCSWEVYFIKSYYEELKRMNKINLHYGYYMQTDKGEVFVVAENIAQAFDNIQKTGDYEKYSLMRTASIPIIR